MRVPALIVNLCLVTVQQAFQFSGWHFADVLPQNRNAFLHIHKALFQGCLNQL